MLIVSSLVFLCGCHISSCEAYKKQGKKLTHEIANEFKGVESKDDLMKRSAKIKKKIDKLTKLMIEAFHECKITTAIDSEINSSEESDRLLYELQRVCEIEGAQEIIERMQREALDKLDEFDKETKLKKHHE